MMIREDQVEAALRILLDKDGRAAKSRAAHEYQQDMTRVVKAQLMAESNESAVSKQEAYAYSHTAYSKHLESVKLLAEEDYRYRDKKAAASAIIDMWRTEQSNQRAGARIG